jgi:hypothetical protein
MTTTVQRIFKPYIDKGGRWRWRCTTVKGRTVSASGESFFNKSTAIRAARQEAHYYGDAAEVREDNTKPGRKKAETISP